MKTFISISLAVLFFVSIPAIAQTTWRAESFANADNEILFFVTGVNAVSVADGNRYKASMQMICTGRADVIGVTMGPITSVGSQSANTKIEIKGEKDRTFYLYRWEVDRTFLKRDITDAQDLIDALLFGDTASVSYTDVAGTDWNATFSLTNFEKHYRLHRETCSRVRPHKDD
jgi:hypothetical protein